MNIYVRLTSMDVSDKNILSIVDILANYFNKHRSCHLVCHRFVDTGLAQRLNNQVHTSKYSGSKFSYMEHADALIYLPGGYGTISSLCASLKAKREGKYDWPIIIVNINCFYDSLFEQFKKIQKYHYCKDAYDMHHKLYQVVTSEYELLSTLDKLCSKKEKS